MQTENDTEGEELLRQLYNSWFRTKATGDLKYGSLFKVETMISGNKAGLLQIRLYIPMTIIYITFVLVMLVVFIRGKILGFVQLILVLVTIINLVPMLTASPLVFIFYYVGDISAPIPYPSCLFFLASLEYLTKIAHMTALSLKLLLAVNRFCGVWYPFKTSIWFSKFRCNVYCTVVVVGSVTVFSIANFSTLPVEKMPSIDDIWGQGQDKLYYGCSMHKASYGLEPEWSLHSIIVMIESAIMLTESSVLLILNILFLHKLKQTNKQRDMMINENEMNKKNDKKVNALNRIYVWVVVTGLFTELPFVVFNGILLSRNVLLIFVGLEGWNNAGAVENIFQWLAGFVYRALIPLDLIIFSLYSQKTRSTLKAVICRK